MSLVIEDPHIEALARALAAREGVTPACAIAHALEAQLGTLASAPDAAAREAALDRIAALQADIARRFPNERAPLPWDTVKAWAEDLPDDSDDQTRRP